MKNNIIITLGLSALAFAACSKSDRNEVSSDIKAA